VSSSNTSERGGIDLLTLAITAAASALAAYVTSQVWAPGTLASAAFTPVLVALIKEALAKPAVVVTRAVPVRGVVRSSTPGDEPPPEPVERVDERVAQHGEIPGRSRPFGRRAWQTAILTGLLGFLVAAVIITVPELVSGKSVTGRGGQTTLLGGDRTSAKPATTTTTTTPSQTQTAPPASTITVPPVETTTVPPAETTTVPPAETTTLPPAQTTPVPPAPQPPAPQPQPQPPAP
jgi:outer membrane biosynthesis protein TonB